MEEFEWNVIHEGQLLESMVGHKPVGVNKYFQMAFICDKFSENFQKEVSSDKVWAHLETMYNLEALDESESIPFPNSERDFALPESEFGALLAKKDEDKKGLQKGRETPKSMKEKEPKKEEKTPARPSKEVPRRDSKDSKEKAAASAKKEAKREPEKTKTKGKTSNNAPREETRPKREDTPKPAKRPTRGSLSLKPDDSSSSGKSSPIPATPPAAKRRRI